MAQYQAYLSDLCLTHNLDNNAGVVSGVLDEAQEQVRGVRGRRQPWALVMSQRACVRQAPAAAVCAPQEDNEAMLAYFFLWRGMKAPTPMSKLDLDVAVEDYLSALIKCAVVALPPGG